MWLTAVGTAGTLASEGGLGMEVTLGIRGVFGLEAGILLLGLIGLGYLSWAAESLLQIALPELSQILHL